MATKKTNAVKAVENDVIEKYSPKAPSSALVERMKALRAERTEAAESMKALELLERMEGITGVLTQAQLNNVQQLRELRRQENSLVNVIKNRERFINAFETGDITEVHKVWMQELKNNDFVSHMNLKSELGSLMQKLLIDAGLIE